MSGLRRAGTDGRITTQARHQIAFLRAASACEIFHEGLRGVEREGTVSTITKDKPSAVRHIARTGGRPLCGGGHGGKTASYQIDLGDDPNCEACLKIALGGAGRF
jgi:hypothetical protein